MTCSFQLSMKKSFISLESLLCIGGISPKQTYRIKVAKFSDARKFRCNLPKIQTKRPNLRVFSQKDANGIANSEDTDPTASRGAV